MEPYKSATHDLHLGSVAKYFTKWVTTSIIITSSNHSLNLYVDGMTNMFPL